MSEEPKGITHPTKCIVSSSPLTIASDTWDDQTGGDNSDVVDERTEASAVEAKSEIDSLLVDVKSWSEKVVDCVPTTLPLTPSPFERGIIGGQSVNDVLMIRGLIPPPTYFHFFDLSSF